VSRARAPGAAEVAFAVRFYVTPLTVLVYLLPIALVLVVRSTRRRRAWEMALDVAMAVAVDLLLILTLARIMTVETAVVASRPIWLLAAFAWVRFRRRRGERIEWPQVLGRGQIVSIGAGVTAAIVLSVQISRPYMMWDREWHISLTSSLRGQTIPFHNVFQAEQALHYHLTGNLLAAELQVLSGNIFNASFALSLAHDIFFGLIAATLGLALVHFAPARPAPIVLGGVALLLVGPFTLRGGVGDPTLGFNFHNFLSLSFRPHVPIGGLMFVGITVAILARLEPSAREPPPLRATLPPLLLCTALLGLTDESGTALIGLGLGCAWLVDPNAVAPTRKDGLLILAGLGVAFIGPNFAFSAALAPGGPLQHMALVPWRNPGFKGEALPLPESIGVLACDVLPFMLCLVALAIIAWETRGARGLSSLLVFLSVMCGVAIVVLTRVQINERADNVQRFMLAPTFVTSLVGILLLDRTGRGSLPRALILIGLGAGAFSSLLWMRERVPSHSPPPDYYNPPGYDLYDLDCRRFAGAHLGEHSGITYVEASDYYLYVGCRPVYVPGSRPSWDILMFPETTVAGFAQVDKEAGEGPVNVVCYRYAETGAICPRITDKSRCTREGEGFVSCPLSPAERAEILSRK
jgi:hypothetical protein